MRLSKPNKDDFSGNEALFRRLMRVDKTSDPAPDSAILQRLQEHLAKQKSAGHIFRNLGGSLLLNMLRYRVPIYQAALGVAFVFVVMLYAGRSPLEDNRPEFLTTGNIQFADTTEILDTLSTSLRPKVGRNLQEDSLLAKFISTVM